MCKRGYERLIPQIFEVVEKRTKKLMIQQTGFLSNNSLIKQIAFRKKLIVGF